MLITVPSKEKENITVSVRFSRITTLAPLHFFHGGYDSSQQGKEFYCTAHQTQDQDWQMLGQLFTEIKTLAFINWSSCDMAKKGLDDMIDR